MDDCLDVVIEIPRGSRNKYEYDHVRGHFKLDRRLFSATIYPADYGFVPETLAEDGDPLDVLVLLEEPTFPGCWIHARPIGVLWMRDEKGEDAKIICVEPNEPRFRDLRDISEIQPELLEEIQHFFDIYKQLEPEKFSSTRAYEGREVAWREIHASKARYAETEH